MLSGTETLESGLVSESVMVLIESESACTRFVGLSTTGTLKGNDCKPSASATTRTMLSPLGVPMAKLLELIPS